MPLTKTGIKLVLLLVSALVLTVVLIFYYMSSEEEEIIEDDVEEIVETESEWPVKSIAGSSVEGRDIEVYTYEPAGVSDFHVIFVGGIHGGYEWNSVLLAYEVMDYLEANPDVVPDKVTVSIVPSANPDGVMKVIGETGRFSPDVVPPVGQTTEGRFNANGVDLNRNFDCNWQSQSTWRGDVVDAGTEAFSEPEARAIRDLVLETDADAVIFWHSASGGVYGSECNEGVLPGTINIMNAYAGASGYPAIESFDYYEITGDAEGWLASIGVPSITVELKTHESIEWEENRAGFEAVLESFGRNGQ